MLNSYLEFGMCICSETFMVMSRCYASACVIFVDFSEDFCWYLVIMSFNGIKLINALVLNILGLIYVVLVILWYASACNPFGWH